LIFVKKAKQNMYSYDTLMYISFFVCMHE